LDGKLLPSTRKEILDIIARMDKIANKCQDIACKFTYQNVMLPMAYRTTFLEITKITKEQYLLMKRALKILFEDYDQLIKNPSILGEIMDKEHEVDRIEDATTLAIFRDESLDLTQRHYYKHFLSQLCDISDRLEDLADQIQVIVVLRKV
jgi:predicted phosphate transport protein (TIGR00153 family)